MKEINKKNIKPLADKLRAYIFQKYVIKSPILDVMICYKLVFKFR